MSTHLMEKFRSTWAAVVAGGFQKPVFSKKDMEEYTEIGHPSLNEYC